MRNRWIMVGCLAVFTLVVLLCGRKAGAPEAVLTMAANEQAYDIIEADTRVEYGAINGSEEAKTEVDKTDTVKPEMAKYEVDETETAWSDESSEGEYDNLAIAQVSNYVNVRKEPDTDSEVLGKIYHGAVAQILDVAGEQEEWFHVVSGSVEGYIKAEYFVYGAEAAEVVEDYVTRRVVVLADRLNVRKEADVSAKRIGYLDCGEKALLLETEGDWVKVSYGNQEGFVAAEFVTIVEEFTYAKSIEEEKAEKEALLARQKREQASEDQAPENTSVTPPDTTAGTNDELRGKIVDYAMQFLGNPYVSGGSSLVTGTDCSGFTSLIYADFGYSISRTPSGQYSSAGRSISYSDAKPGDIICYGKSKCTHVGIYIGDGQIIHEANSRKGVVIYQADYDNILGVRNVID